MDLFHRRVPGSGDEAEISLGTGNDEVNHDNVDGAIIHSRPKRKPKSLGEVSLALYAKRKQKPRGRPFTKRNKVEPQEQEYGEEVEVVEGELELDEESSEEAEASTSF
ncbi:hypothetical protein K435DRAFT_805705 [Dendrothele bispora CBS 962.96]|uniref:Uncharacterized protein n=1 Tax=Dendrothele bispora (strain CBS 962.96) TaxID=1314807 RepID=A0A4S8LA49_DENBC|nr:hypothetical protein K435DRAFT_805705 [Dendrothele bispora CBS 962.96]